MVLVALMVLLSRSLAAWRLTYQASSPFPPPSSPFRLVVVVI